jgi:hypothetical protein
LEHRLPSPVCPDVGALVGQRRETGSMGVVSHFDLPGNRSGIYLPPLVRADRKILPVKDSRTISDARSMHLSNTDNCFMTPTNASSISCARFRMAAPALRYWNQEWTPNELPSPPPRAPYSAPAATACAARPRCRRTAASESANGAFNGRDRSWSFARAAPGAQVARFDSRHCAAAAILRSRRFDSRTQPRSLVARS